MAWTATETSLVIAAVGGLITVLTTSAVSLVGLWRLNTKIDGMLVDRDKAKVLEGKREGVAAGEATAKTLAEGQRQGAENERASVAAASPPNGITARSPDTEVPTKDKRVAAATERSAAAQERVANAAEDATTPSKKP